MTILDVIRRNTEKDYKAKPIEPDSHTWMKREIIEAELGNKTEPCFEGSKDDRSHGQRGRPFTKERSRSPAREITDEDGADEALRLHISVAFMTRLKQEAARREEEG